MSGLEMDFASGLTLARIDGTGECNARGGPAATSYSYVVSRFGYGGIWVTCLGYL